jgi:hypothetical protein
MSTPEDGAVIEAVVAAMTPAAASAAAPPAAPAEMPHCDNCGAGVAGKFCSNCGQRVEPPLHSLRHFLTVAFEDVTHADSRLWRTLAALLFKPGFLTREFLHGRRARYLPPVRLYLVISLVFFVWLSTIAQPAPDEAHMTPEQRAEVAKARQSVEKVRRAAGSSAIVIAPGIDVSAPAAAPASAAPPSAAPASAAPASAAPASAAPASAAPKEAFHGSSLEGDTEHCQKISYQGFWREALVRGCEQAAKDRGRSLLESFMHNLPRAMFVFLPLLAAVMMLLYWHPRHYYVEHLLFYVHNHAFFFLMILLAGVLGTLLPSLATLIGWLTTLYIAWYVYRSMRVMYGQGRVRTLSKLAVLGVVYLLAASVMLGITGFYSLMSSG